MTRLVFIAGQSHSGSTLLDLVLGAHSRLVGLGEIAEVVRHAERDLGTVLDVPCSCGSRLEACEYWGEVIRRWQATSPRSEAARFEIIFQTFTDVFGDALVPVDSSKYPDCIESLDDQFDLELRAIHIIKDVRAFTISQIDNAKQSGAPAPKPFALFKEWHGRNEIMKRRLAARGIPTLQIGYEELCMNSERIARRICDFLELEFEPQMLELGASKSHIGFGNRMRAQSTKRAIRYDHRWFSRREWELPALLLRRIMRYNRENVYRNQTDELWQP